MAWGGSLNGFEINTCKDATELPVKNGTVCKVSLGLLDQVWECFTTQKNSPWSPDPCFVEASLPSFPALLFKTMNMALSLAKIVFQHVCAFSPWSCWWWQVHVPIQLFTGEMLSIQTWLATKHEKKTSSKLHAWRHVRWATMALQSKFIEPYHHPLVALVPQGRQQCWLGISPVLVSRKALRGRGSQGSS